MSDVDDKNAVVVRIYSFADEAVKTISKWFRLNYGVLLNRKQVVQFVIHSLEELPAVATTGTLVNLLKLPEMRTVMVTPGEREKLQVLVSRLRDTAIDIPIFLTAAIIYRANTLPEGRNNARHKNSHSRYATDTEL